LPTVTCYNVSARPILFFRDSKQKPAQEGPWAGASPNLKKGTFVAWRTVEVLGTVKTDRSNENLKSAALSRIRS
jgi:hypothetical protein